MGNPVSHKKLLEKLDKLNESVGHVLSTRSYGYENPKLNKLKENIKNEFSKKAKQSSK